MKTLKPLGSAAAALSLAFALPVHAQSASSSSTAERAWTQDEMFRSRPGAPDISDLPPAVVSPDAARGLARLYGGAPISVTTFHYDNNRTGWNSSETDLTPAQLKAKNFGLLTTLPVDGTVFAQPLLVSGYTMPDGSVHDVLIVATANNSVYAFDAQTYAVLWQVNLGAAQNSYDINCVDVDPEYGIAATPVIIPAPKPTYAGQMLVYVIAGRETPGTPPSYWWEVHGLDLGSGVDVPTSEVLSGSETLTNGQTVAFDSRLQWPRAGMAYSPTTNSILIGVGSHCDLNSVSTGWLFSYTPNLTPETAFPTIQIRTKGILLGGIWMSGFAPAIDASGNIFVATGNGPYQDNPGAASDWAQSVLKLAPDLSAVNDHFTAGNYAMLNLHNWDLGAGGVMLLPTVPGQTADPMLVAMGKDPTMYLLDQTNLGGFSLTNTGALQVTTLGTSPSGLGLYGGPAFYNGPNGPTVYYQISGHVLDAFSVSTASPPSMALTVQSVGKGSSSGSDPIVSSNGSGAAAGDSGIVWVIRRSSPPTLQAYDALTLGEPIWQSNAGTWLSNNHGRFISPLVANGRVYVGTGAPVPTPPNSPPGTVIFQSPSGPVTPEGQVMVFGLLN